jgi:hypothetical protein
MAISRTDYRAGRPGKSSGSRSAGQLGYRPAARAKAGGARPRITISIGICPAKTVRVRQDGLGDTPDDDREFNGLQRLYSMLKGGPARASSS